MLKYVGVLVVFFVVSVSAQAKHNSDHPLSPEEWKEIMEKVILLEGSGLLPTLLPVIMRNRDTPSSLMISLLHFVPGEKRTTRT